MSMKLSQFYKLKYHCILLDTSGYQGAIQAFTFNSLMGNVAGLCLHGPQHHLYIDNVIVLTLLAASSKFQFEILNHIAR